jgi:hypothetical protein
LLLRGVSGSHCYSLLSPLIILPKRCCGGSASVEKDKGFDLAGWFGLLWGGCDALVTRPCLDVDLFSKEVPTPLRFCSAVSNKKKVGVLPLFTAIEESHLEQVLASCSSLGKKKVIDN